MPGNFKDYFYFTKGERNGILLLLMLMAAVIVFPHIYMAVKSKNHGHPDPGFIARVHAFHYSVKENGSVKLCSSQDSSGNNPVKLREPGRPAPSYRSEPDSTSFIMIDLNSADTSGLMKIRGIGPVLSRRILRYRDILGGYYDVSQLMEVYGIDEDKYLKTKPFVFADTGNVIKLRLSADEFGVLLRHPYLSFEQVSEIFRLRDANTLNSFDDLLNSDAFMPEDISRLSGYIKFD